jgi:hypothetical protein
MSKIIYIYHRNPKSTVDIKKRLHAISKRILPDNITPAPSHIIEKNGIVVGIFNPSEAVNIIGCSVCLGNIVGTKEWQLPRQGHPDGTYALFRSDDNYIEVLTDMCATRTIWYYMDDDIFIASTSQRAIVLMLGNFEFNEDVIPWVLSSGTIGFDNSWDSRISRVFGDSSLLLDRKSWELTSHTNDIVFNHINRTETEHEEALKGAIEDSVGNLNLNFNDWVLPLSGGYDSRAILCFIKNKTGLKTITWGLREAVYDDKNDAYIAKRLASYFNLPNTYYELDTTKESIEKIFDRFIICGEGRIDHVSGYIDGFHLWKTLYEQGIKGIIRGDNGMGWKRGFSDFDVRNTIEIPTCSDFTNLANLVSSGDFKQNFPDILLQRKDETWEAWRDRLHHQYRIPIVLAALSDLKVSYVELINPLLTKKIIGQVRKLPDYLRTDKTLHKNISLSVSPKIALAAKSAVPSSENILKSKQVVDFLKDYLSSDYVTSMFPKSLMNTVFIKIKALDSSKNIKSYSNKIKAFVPKRLKSKYRTVAKPEKNSNVLAFRIYLISRMKKIISEDIQNLS